MVRDHDLHWYARDVGNYAHLAGRMPAGEVFHRDVQNIHAGYIDFVNAAAFRLFDVGLVSMRYPLAVATIEVVTASPPRLVIADISDPTFTPLATEFLRWTERHALRETRLGASRMFEPGGATGREHSLPEDSTAAPALRTPRCPA